MQQELFVSTLNKWSTWSSTAGKNNSVLPLYLLLSPTEDSSLPGEYINEKQLAEFLRNIKNTTFVGFTTWDFSTDYFSRPCNDTRTFSQLVSGTMIQTVNGLNLTSPCREANVTFTKKKGNATSNQTMDVPSPGMTTKPSWLFILIALALSYFVV
jgi:hypothetical protein